MRDTFANEAMPVSTNEAGVAKLLRFAKVPNWFAALVVR